MRWTYKLSLRLRSLFRKTRVERELSDELRYHLEKLIEENVAKGLTAVKARYAALRELGGVEQIKEECRDMRRVNYIENFLQDVRYALRQLRRNPGFTAVAVLTLTLGIGANTAIFSLIDAVMLRSPAVRDPQRLVILKWHAHKWPKTHAFYGWSACPTQPSDSATPVPEGCSFSQPMFEEIHAEKEVFSGVFAFVPAIAREMVVSVSGHASVANAELASGDYFPALGVCAALGRTLSPPDDLANASPVAVLSYGYWRTQFGGDPSVLGKSILLNGIPFTVVGIAAPEFSGLDPGTSPDMWLPLSSQIRIGEHWPEETDAASWWLLVMARLNRGVGVAQAQAATDVVFRQSVTSSANLLFKPEDAPHVVLLSATHGLASVRKALSQPLFLLMAAVAIVLLIAGANVASLMLARATARQKEMAVRFALGAGRGRIVRQLLTESLMIAASGGVLGVLLANWGASSLAAFLSANGYSPLEIQVHPDLRVLGFTLTVSLLVGILFGLAPAFRGARVDVAPALNEAVGSLSKSSLARRRFGLYIRA